MACQSVISSVTSRFFSRSQFNPAKRLNHQTPEPSTGWALISRLSFVGCLLLMFGGLALRLLPEFKALRESDEKIASLKQKVDQLGREKERLESESVLLDGDKKFIEIKARDLLDLHKPGETIFRFTK